MPDAYKDPRFGDLGNKTVYLVPTGESMVFFNTCGANMKTVTDGTSRTILAVEADPERAVPWTKPDDLEIDVKQPVDGLGSVGGIFLVVAVDGRSTFCPATSIPIRSGLSSHRWPRASHVSRHPMKSGSLRGFKKRLEGMPRGEKSDYAGRNGPDLRVCLQSRQQGISIRNGRLQPIFAAEAPVRFGQRLPF